MEKNERMKVELLYEIMRKLDKIEEHLKIRDDWSDSNLDEMNREIYRNGYVSEYNEFENEFSEDESRKVKDTLDVYRIIQCSYDRLSDDDKKLLECSTDFPGWDGHKHSDYILYANFLKKNGKWDDLRVTSGYDSHSYNPNYDEIIKRFNEIKSKFIPINENYFSLDDIKYILDK